VAFREASKEETDMVARFMVLAGLAAVSAMTLGALACRSAGAQPKSGGDQCFARREIAGFRAPNDRTVYVRVGVSDVYRFDLMGDCAGLSFREDIGLQSVPGGDPWICKPIQATVVYREQGIPSVCPVSAIHKLTPEEFAALPKRDGP
jgi:hypothetical protein